MFDAISFKGYKSFSSNSDVILDRIGRVTVLIGKNNCGKSTVLDIIGAACDASSVQSSSILPKKVCRGYSVPSNTYRNAYIRNHSNIYNYKLPEHYYSLLFWSRVKFASSFANSTHTIQLSTDYERDDNVELSKTSVDWHSFHNSIAREKYRFLKLAAERNILPEMSANKEILMPNGDGATNLIRRIINNSRFDETLIERKLLDALNEIMATDAHFDSIRVQEKQFDREKNEMLWEVYLQETNNERFPLSQSGSGLKTIVLVLLNLLVVPTLRSENEIFTFGFEELENNLHPALQRRLFEYIYRYAVKNDIYVFLTTHSHVAINMFYEKQDTALYHVIKENGVSSVKRIESYMDKAEILDDLDVKASDLLQANGIIWVEGPSDRIYIKRWLEVFGGTDIGEGKDFQFAYYGGRLLSHYSTEDTADLLNILMVNRNSAIVMDSDKRSQATPINRTKKRIVQEFQEKRLFSWITKGKEIENYLSVNAINTALSVDIGEQCGVYELFPEYISKHYRNFSVNKVVFANLIRPHVDATGVLDLEPKIRTLYETIKSWNK